MVYLSLGSNLGDRLDYLHRAVSLLKQRYLKHLRCSIVIETSCLLPEGAPLSWNLPFLNMVVSGETDLAPLDLLAGLKEIERELGRPEQYPRWSPRVMDLDILIWEGQHLSSPQLSLPHPELTHRPFLLHLLNLMGKKIPQNTPLEACFSKSFVLFPQLVGIINATSDSFSDGGVYNAPEKVLARALALRDAGASIIEIGVQSTRLGATLQTPEAEYTKLQTVLEPLKPYLESGEIKLSVDTFWPSVIQQLLDHYPIAWINDVKGGLDDITLKKLLERNCQLCLMHSLHIPHTPEFVLPPESIPSQIIQDWAEQQLERLLNLGFRSDQIILDPGIGFGKSPYQNLELLRHISTLKKLGSPVLIGHSRKSYLTAFSKQPPADRDIETLATSAFLADKVDYLRVHAVAEHQRFLVARQVLNGEQLPDIEDPVLNEVKAREPEADAVDNWSMRMLSGEVQR